MRVRGGWILFSQPPSVDEGVPGCLAMVAEGVTVTAP